MKMGNDGFMRMSARAAQSIRCIWARTSRCQSTTARFASLERLKRFSQLNCRRGLEVGERSGRKGGACFQPPIQNIRAQRPSFRARAGRMFALRGWFRRAAGSTPLLYALSATQVPALGLERSYQTPRGGGGAGGSGTGCGPPSLGTGGSGGGTGWTGGAGGIGGAGGVGGGFGGNGGFGGVGLGVAGGVGATGGFGGFTGRFFARFAGGASSDCTDGTGRSTARRFSFAEVASVSAWIAIFVTMKNSVAR